MTGHLLGAAGALETIISALSGHHRVIPATINVDEIDLVSDLDIVRGQARPLPDGDVAVLNNSFGFGGHNVALTIRGIA